MVTEKKQDKNIASKKFLFTKNLGKEEVSVVQFAKEREALENILRNIAHKWAFQLEKGTEANYYHIQGVVALKKSQRLNKFKVFCKEELGASVIPLEGFYKDGVQYCLKKDTAVNNETYSHFDDRKGNLDKEGNKREELVAEEREEFNKVERSSLFYLFEELFAKERFSKRKVHFFYDEKGSMGKSTLARYLRKMKHYFCYDVPEGSSQKDIQQAIASYFDHDTKQKSTIVVLDLPRTCDRHTFRNVLSVTEQIKNGSLADLRYRYRVAQLPYYTDVLVLCNDLYDAHGNRLKDIKEGTLKEKGSCIYGHMNKYNTPLLEIYDTFNKNTTLSYDRIQLLDWSEQLLYLSKHSVRTEVSYRIKNGEEQRIERDIYNTTFDTYTIDEFIGIIA